MTAKRITDKKVNERKKNYMRWGVSYTNNNDEHSKVQSFRENWARGCNSNFVFQTAAISNPVVATANQVTELQRVTQYCKEKSRFSARTFVCAKEFTIFMVEDESRASSAYSIWSVEVRKLCKIHPYA